MSVKGEDSGGLPLNSSTERKRNIDKARQGAVLSSPSQNVLQSPQGASGEATR